MMKLIFLCLIPVGVFCSLRHDPLALTIVKGSPSKEMLNCRDESRGDKNVFPVMSAIGYDYTRWVGVWAGFTKVARGPVSASSAEKYKRTFKADVDAPFDAVHVPAGKCPSVPADVMAYSHIAQELCLPRGRMEVSSLPALARSYPVPTATSACSARLLMRMFSDSNKAEEGGIRPKAMFSVTEFDKTLWLVFRATDEDVDWTAMDFNAVIVPFVHGGKTYGHVHRGFFNAVMLLDREYGLARTAKRYADRGYKIVVTGHSLGGALTTIASLLIKLTAPSARVHAITFGSPRVGNSVFAQNFDQRVDKSTRMVTVFNCNGSPVADLFCSVPPKVGQTGEGIDSVTMLLQTSENAKSTRFGAQKLRAFFMKVKDNALRVGKDAVTKAAGAVFRFKHVKGFQRLDGPAFPDFKCTSNQNKIDMGTSEHGHYRRQEMHRFLVWAFRNA
jgi:hypothetical protein